MLKIFQASLFVMALLLASTAFGQMSKAECERIFKNLDVEKYRNVHLMDPRLSEEQGGIDEVRMTYSLRRTRIECSENALVITTEDEDEIFYIPYRSIKLIHMIRNRTLISGGIKIYLLQP